MQTFVFYFQLGEFVFVSKTNKMSNYSTIKIIKKTIKMSSKPKRTVKVKVARIRVRSLKRSLNHYKKFKRLLELLSKNKLKNVSCDYVTRMKC
jgi:hypothetical protein